MRVSLYCYFPVEIWPVPFSAINSCLPVVNIKGYCKLNPMSGVLHMGLPLVCYKECTDDDD